MPLVDEPSVQIVDLDKPAVEEEAACPELTHDSTFASAPLSMEEVATSFVKEEADDLLAQAATEAQPAEGCLEEAHVAPRGSRSSGLCPAVDEGKGLTSSQELAPHLSDEAATYTGTEDVGQPSIEASHPIAKHSLIMQKMKVLATYCTYCCLSPERKA